jgi:hypothetical protein
MVDSDRPRRLTDRYVTTPDDDTVAAVMNAARGVSTDEDTHPPVYDDASVALTDAALSTLLFGASVDWDLTDETVPTDDAPDGVDHTVRVVARHQLETPETDHVTAEIHADADTHAVREIVAY